MPVYVEIGMPSKRRKKQWGTLPSDANMMNQCLIGLGANLPTSTRTPMEALVYALELICVESTRLKSISRWFSTPAFPKGSGPDYINGVVSVETDLPPKDLLKHLAAIEEKLGRVRETRWGARVCDLDLLDYQSQILPDLDTYEHWRDLNAQSQLEEAPKELILPHPRVQDRAFVLVPLYDVEPNWVHPVSGLSVQKLISALPEADVTSVRPVQNNANL